MFPLNSFIIDREARWVTDETRRLTVGGRADPLTLKSIPVYLRLVCPHRISAHKTERNLLVGYLILVVV
jgi:hypothetical protein